MRGGWPAPVAQPTHRGADRQDRQEQPGIEASQVDHLELGWNGPRELRRRVPPEVMHRLVLRGPEERERRYRDHRDAARGELGSGPAKRRGVVLQVLEHVQHAEHVQVVRERLRDTVLLHLEAVAERAAQVRERERARLAADDLAESGKRRQVAAAPAAHLGEPQLPRRTPWREPAFAVVTNDAGRRWLKAHAAEVAAVRRFPWYGGEPVAPRRSPDVTVARLRPSRAALADARRMLGGNPVGPCPIECS